MGQASHPLALNTQHGRAVTPQQGRSPPHTATSCVPKDGGGSWQPEDARPKHGTDQVEHHRCEACAADRVGVLWGTESLGTQEAQKKNQAVEYSPTPQWGGGSCQRGSDSVRQVQQRHQLRCAQRRPQWVQRWPGSRAAESCPPPCVPCGRLSCPPPPGRGDSV